jgi:DNA-binding NarL/FixJ family response regulator
VPRARVLLADDHAEFLALAAELVNLEFDVVKTLENGAAVLEEVSSLDPDVIVLDISMSPLSGIETAERLMARDKTAKIVFLTVHEDVDYLRSALATGALGYVVKDRLASDLIPALRLALAGELFISASLASHIGS